MWGEHRGEGGTVGVLQMEVGWMESSRDQPCTE